MIDLATELRALCSLFAPTYRDLHERLQLPADLMVHLAQIGVGRIVTHGDFFDFAEDGELAVIVPVFDGPHPCFVAPVDPPPPLMDLVAIPLSQPRRFYLRVGAADVIGTDRIASAHTWQSPLRLFDTPLGWLRGRCNGACVLDPEVTWKLFGISDVIYDDKGHARRTNRWLRRPPAAVPRSWIATETPP